MIKEEIEKVLAGEVHSYTSPSGVIIEAYRNAPYPSRVLFKVDGNILYDKDDIDFIINNYYMEEVRDEKLDNILNDRQGDN